MADVPITDVVARVLASQHSAFLRDAVRLAREVVRLTAGIEALEGEMAKGSNGADYEVVLSGLRALLAPASEEADRG